MLELHLAILGKKKHYEGYAGISAGGTSDLNLDPPDNRVYILLSVDVSMERNGYVAIYSGNRTDSWLLAKKIIHSYGENTVISINNIFLIATDQDRIKIRVSNSHTNASSTVYVNAEYLDLSETDYNKIKDLIKKQYGVS